MLSEIFNWTTNGHDYLWTISRSVCCRWHNNLPLPPKWMTKPLRLPMINERKMEEIVIRNVLRQSVELMGINPRLRQEWGSEAAIALKEIIEKGARERRVALVNEGQFGLLQWLGERLHWMKPETTKWEKEIFEEAAARGEEEFITWAVTKGEGCPVRCATLQAVYYGHMHILQIILNQSKMRKDNSAAIDTMELYTLSDEAARGIFWWAAYGGQKQVLNWLFAGLEREERRSKNKNKRKKEEYRLSIPSHYRRLREEILWESRVDALEGAKEGEHTKLIRWLNRNHPILVE